MASVGLSVKDGRKDRERQPSRLDRTRRITVLGWGAILAFFLGVAVSVVASFSLTASIVDRLLMSHAEQRVSEWARNFQRILPNIDEIAAGRPATQAEKAIIDDALESGVAFRVKVFDASGRTRLLSNRASDFSHLANDLPAQSASPHALDVLTTGQPVVFVEHGGGRSGYPEIYAEVYFPIVEDGRAVAAIEVYIDQTVVFAKYQEDVFYETVLIGLLTALAFTAPAILAWIRSGQVARVNRELDFLSEHDSLTRLPKRIALDRRWPELIASARGRGGSIAVLHVDLDHFKRVNDRLGHASGNALLIEVGKRLSARFGRGDVVARAGWDEFMAVVATKADGERARACGEEVLETLQEPFALGGHEFRLGASVGLAMAACDDADLDRLASEANTAMIDAKAAGRFQVAVFDSERAARMLAEKRLADDLFRAVDGEEIEAHFQLQVNAHSFDVVGVEALARWRHPELGLIPPPRFVPLAADLGLIDRIDERVLSEAALAVRAIEAQTGLAMKLGVNASMRRLSDLTLIDRVAAIEPPKGGLAFEILESVFLDEADDAVRWNLDQLRERGVELELDDFGSGRASVISLLRTRPDRIKIDRGLVHAIEGDSDQVAVVKAVVDMARALGIRVLAEGVETEAQALTLRRLGVGELQGYFFGKPMPFEALEARILAGGRVSRPAP